MKHKWIVLLVILILVVPYKIDTSGSPPWHICEGKDKFTQISAVTYSMNADFMCGKLYIFRIYIGDKYRPKALSARYAWCICWEKRNMLIVENLWEYNWENQTWEDKMNIPIFIDWEW